MHYFEKKKFVGLVSYQSIATVPSRHHCSNDVTNFEQHTRVNKAVVIFSCSPILCIQYDCLYMYLLIKKLCLESYRLIHKCNKILLLRLSIEFHSKQKLKIVIFLLILLKCLNSMPFLFIKFKSFWNFLGTIFLVNISFW